MGQYVKIERLDVMITFKNYSNKGPVPYILSREDPGIEWNPDKVYFYLYGNYSVMEIKTENEWKTALVKERLFRTSMHIESYLKGFGSKVPVMCFLNREDAKKAEQEHVVLDINTYKILKEQDLIKTKKDLPKIYQIYSYD